MDYAKLVAVSGLPGLFELLSSKTDGAIVRSLEDNTTKFAASRIHNFSHLESIEVYTVRDNVNLVDIFHAMEKGGDLPDTKDNTAVKKYFEKTYPDMDFDRVYGSDLKKMVKWFEVLQKNKVEIKLSEPVEEEQEQQQQETVIETAKKEAKETKAPAKKEVKERPAIEKKETSGKEIKEKKPAAKKDKEDETPKKAAPKKKK